MTTKCEQIQPLLRECDAADVIGVSVRTLQKWRVSGEGPPWMRLSKMSKRGAVRYSIEDLAKWIASSRRQSTSEAGGKNVD